MRKVKAFHSGITIVRDGQLDDPVKIESTVVELMRLTGKSSVRFHVSYPDGVHEMVTLRDLLDTGPWYYYDNKEKESQ